MGDVVRQFSVNVVALLLHVGHDPKLFNERQVIQALAPLQQSGELKVEIYGKRFPGALAGVPDTRGLNPSLLIERLVPLIRDHASLPIELTNGRLSAELERIELTGDMVHDLILG